MSKPDARKERFTLAVDSSQIAAYLDCPQKWFLAYRENLTRKFEKRTAMDRGTVLHGLLERYYRMRAEGKDQQSCYNHAISDLTRILQENGGKVKDLSLTHEDYVFCLDRFTAYWTYYNQNDFTPLVVEGVPAVEIGFSVPIIDNENFLLVLEGRIDFIGQQQGLIFLVDHKSQGRVYDHYSRTLQFMNYCLALQIQLGTPIDRVMINYIGTQEKLVPEKHFRRKLFYYHPRVLQNWHHKLITILYRMSMAVMNSDYEKNENSCQGRLGFPCSFTLLCETLSQPQFIQIRDTKYQQKTPWQPWLEEE